MDLKVRDAHYARTMGAKHLRSFVSVDQEELAPGFLENFILQQVQEGLPARYLGVAVSITNTIIEESNRRGFDPLFVLAMMQHESKMNPAARGLHGEIGLMQILPNSAKWISQKMDLPFNNKKDLLDPVQNIRIGVAYLSMLEKKFKKTSYAAAAYNMGVLNVNRLLARGEEPQIYFSKVMNEYKSNYLELEAYALAGHEKSVTTVAWF